MSRERFEAAEDDIHAVLYNADLYDDMQTASDLLRYLLSNDSVAGNLIRAQAVRDAVGDWLGRPLEQEHYPVNAWLHDRADSILRNEDAS